MLLVPFIMRSSFGKVVEKNTMGNVMQELGREIGKSYARPAGEHVSLGWPLRGVLFAVPFGILALLLYSAVTHRTLRQDI